MRRSIGWFLLVSLLLLAACSGPGRLAADKDSAEPLVAETAATAEPPTPTETQPVEATVPEEPETASEGAEALPTAESAEAPTELPTEVPAVELAPTPRTELQATNPREVRLASGGPQFVEFFAYW